MRFQDITQLSIQPLHVSEQSQVIVLLLSTNPTESNTKH
jgi:hypothetical protein